MKSTTPPNKAPTGLVPSGRKALKNLVKRVSSLQDVPSGYYELTAQHAQQAHLFLNWLRSQPYKHHPSASVHQFQHFQAYQHLVHTTQYYEYFPSGTYNNIQYQILDFPFVTALRGVVLNIMEWSDDPKHEVEVDADGARAIPTGLPFKGSQGVVLKNYLRSLLKNSADMFVDNNNRIRRILSDLYHDGNLL